jgi:N4-gp56 family major capsid protein
MAEISTADTNFDRTLVALVMRNIEENARRALKWLTPGDYRSGTLIPGSNLIRYIAYGDIPVNSATLDTDYGVTVEGSPTQPVDFAIGYDEFGASQKMKTIRLTDVAMDMSPHDLMGVAAERAAFNAMAVMDMVAANVVAPIADDLDGTPTPPAWVKFADGVANETLITATTAGTAGGGLNGEEVKRMVATLKAAEIAPYGDGFYRAKVHPNVTFDLMNDTAVGGWIEASKYAASTQLLDGEIGRYAGVRFVETTVNTWRKNNGGVGAALPIYQTIFHGPDYFAWGDLQTTRAYLVRPGGNHADPAAQSALVSWKGMWGAKVLTGLATFTGVKHRRLVHSGILPGALPINAAP